MSIKTNHSDESLTPSSGVLKVNASGAIGLPSGDQTERPTGIAGYIRFATDLTKPEYFDGTNWQMLTNKEYVDNAMHQITFDSLLDVTTTNPSDGQIVAYDANLGQFRTQTIAMNIVTRLFSGDGQTLSFDIITSVSSVQELVVSINGISQEPFYSYTIVDGHFIIFDEAPESGDRIQVKILKSTTASDRPRPRIRNISYSIISNYTTISIVATDVTFGTGVKIGGRAITRIDYPTSETIQVMIETSRMSDAFWGTAQDLVLVDTSGNEFVYEKLINYGSSKPYWTTSATYIGSFSGGDSINFPIGVNNVTSLTLGPAYAGESDITWLSVSGNNIVGTAPNNSSPSRYEIKITASNGSVDITKNYWLLVI